VTSERIMTSARKIMTSSRTIMTSAKYSICNEKTELLSLFSDNKYLTKLYIMTTNNLLYDSTFWLSMTTLLVGSIAVTIKACYKSKCSNFRCCYGLIDIERYVDIEEHIDIEQGANNRRDSIPSRD
jgi:hypothetical protein